MLHTKQSDIRNFLKEHKYSKDVVNVTYLSHEEITKILERDGDLETIAISTGIYGCNGKIWYSHLTHTFYVSYDRTIAIFTI